MIKGHTDIDIWNTGFFINADYFSDDFIIYRHCPKFCVNGNRIQL